MVLGSWVSVAAFIVFVLVLFYESVIKKKFTILHILGVILLIVTVVVNIYHYRSLGLDDVISQEKYAALSQPNHQIVAEEIDQPEISDQTVLDMLPDVRLRRVLSSRKTLESDFADQTNSYVITKDGKNVFRLNILGSFEYLETGGVFYRILNSTDK